MNMKLLLYFNLWFASYDKNYSNFNYKTTYTKDNYPLQSPNSFQLLLPRRQPSFQKM